MDRWNELVALAREIEAALAAGAPIEADKARRLAQLVLAEPQPPAGPNGDAAADRRGASPR